MVAFVDVLGMWDECLGMWKLVLLIFGEFEMSI